MIGIATCNFIQESKQNTSSLCAVIRYVSQEKKTVDENGKRYLSGVNCVGEIAYDEFMATKNLWHKTGGMYFYQYTQSFAPGEIKSYEEAHSIGVELAEKFFNGCEVLVATHLDAVSNGEERIHNHFIVNSVRPDDGKKVHFDNRTLEKMRAVSDEICVSHGLSVLKPYEQNGDTKAVGTREYRAALKGESFKFNLISDIEAAMTMCGSREEFIDLMTNAGYSVRWEDTRKYITYTCPGGQKVRDNKLHETKFLKGNMEYEFRIRNQTGEHTGSTQEIVGRYDTDAGRERISAESSGDSDRAMGGVLRMGAGGGDLPADAVQADRNACDAGGSDRNDGELSLGAGRDRARIAEVDNADLGRDCGQLQDNAGGCPFGERTGWESARAIYLERQSRSRQPVRQAEWAEAGGGRTAEEISPLYGNDYHSGGRQFGAAQCDRLSADELTAFFSGECEAADEILDDEDDEQPTPLSQLLEQAKLGNRYAMYRLSMKYFTADDNNFDPDRGAYWLERAAEDGYVYAEYRIGKMYYLGSYYERDAGSAEYWLGRAADKHNAFAEALLGKALITGDFLRSDVKRGIDLLYDAENDGSSYAAYTLGKLYADGEKVKKNIPKAIEHLERAAQMGNIFAEYRLAKIYLFESDLYDWNQAVELLETSARKGNEYAYMALQRMNENILVSVTTDIASIIADLSVLFDNRRPIEDCTTILPQKKERKHQAWEIKM